MVRSYISKNAGSKKIRDGFLKIDPNSAGYYDDNSKNYVGKLEFLDASTKAAFLNVTKKTFSFSSMAGLSSMSRLM
jgi:ABC-type Zn uptake system ZnuABC Zn-binding protein ZnuA